MTVPARITFITLACADIDRMTRFYRQFGWPEAPSSEPAHVVLQCSNGVVLALYAARNYEASLGKPATGFRGFTLCINCKDMEEVRDINRKVKEMADVHDLGEPQLAPWGGGFSFRDPEGNIWDVAWAEGSRFDERGGLTFP